MTDLPKEEKSSVLPKVGLVALALLFVGGVAFLESRGMFELNLPKPESAHLVATPAFTPSLEDALTGNGSVACEIESDATGGTATVSVKDGVIRVDKGLGTNAVHAIIRGEEAFLWREDATEGRVENALDSLSFGFASKYEISRALAINETLCSAFTLSDELFALPVGVVFPGAASVVSGTEGVQADMQNLPQTLETLEDPMVVE